MNLSELAANGSKLDLAIAEAQGKVTVKKLRTRKPRRGETWSPANKGGRVVGVANSENGLTAGNRAAAGGGQMTITGQGGQGKEMVANLDRVVNTYNKVIAAEHRANAREEARLRRLEREANACAAIDALLESI